MRTVQGSHFYVLIFSRKVALTRGETGVVLLRFSAANGAMTLIADWPHVPKQVEVQKEIDEACDGYTTFVLCTPTSIIPASNESVAGGWHRPTGPGRR